MGIFDKKPAGSSDFSDTKGSSSSSSSSSADFSDVSGGASSSAPDVGAGQSYTVKSGDSLSKIAKHFYGDASKWHKIYDANRDKINNPDLIHPGQEFSIPSE